MVANKEIEKCEHSSVKLTVTIEQKALREEYDTLLKKYTKEAHIKGFRKGKAPPAIIERKFGEGIKQEAAANSIENGLKEIFEEIDEKPLPYTRPQLEDEDLEPDLDKNLTFTVSYDVFPEIELGTYKEIEVTEPQVKITEEDEKRELDNLRDRNAIVIDKQDATVAQDDIITIDYAELDDEDNEIEGTKRESFVFTVGSGYNLHKIDDDVIGMKKDETKVVEKEYPEDFEIDTLQGKKVRLKITIKAVKVKDLPELDDELAQDISDEYETLEDLKKDIRENLEKAAEQKVRQTKVDQLIDKIVENSTIDLPESMIQAELDNSWSQFLQRSRIPEDQADKILKMQGKTREDLREEWRPSAEKRLKSRLLISKIIEEEKIEVADNEIDDAIREQAEQNNMEAADLRKQYEEANYMDLVTGDIKDKKVLDFLLDQAKIKKGKTVNFLDFMDDKQ